MDSVILTLTICRVYCQRMVSIYLYQPVASVYGFCLFHFDSVYGFCYSHFDKMSCLYQGMVSIYLYQPVASVYGFCFPHFDNMPCLCQRRPLQTMMTGHLLDTCYRSWGSNSECQPCYTRSVDLWNRGIDWWK